MLCENMLRKLQSSAIRRADPVDPLELSSVLIATFGIVGELVDVIPFDQSQALRWR